jgi:hypothetical protein
MARQTFTQLQTTSKDYISQASGSFASSTVANFIKEHINKRYHFIQSKLGGFITTDLPQTCSTVDGQQRYHYPQNIYPPITSATLEIGDVYYPLKIVQNQMEWDKLNEISFSGTAYPQYIYPMRDHFEVWPKPQADGDTITLVASMLDRDMTAEDYTTGTVTLTANSATVTGSGTTYTAAMVGRWFQGNADQFWYRIAGFTSTTVITLESVFEGSTVAGDTYTIGEVPEIPPELHELIPHGVAADFYAGPRKDFKAAQAHNNYFWTGDFMNSSRNVKSAVGGLIGAINKYSRRGDSAIVHKNIEVADLYDERWTATLSSSI